MISERTLCLWDATPVDIIKDAGRLGERELSMLEPFIIRRIREEEERQRRERRSPQIPLYYEPPPPPRERPKKEDAEEETGGTVIEIDL